MSIPTPFGRTHIINKPGIIGARWWQESISIANDPIARRDALRRVLIIGGAVASVGIIGSVTALVMSESEQVNTEQRNSLKVQREYGWDFAARGEPLAFDGEGLVPFDPSSLGTLDLTFSQQTSTFRPYVRRTLFESLTARPTQLATDDSTPFTPLKDVLQPRITPIEESAYKQGKSLGSLLKGTRDIALIVDMNGPQSVAFAAGLADAFTPIVTFDNWPHPRGVVPAHRTLAALAYYQPLFDAKNRERAPSAPPVFVLARDRLNSYSDQSTQFDNRYIAQMPTIDDLKKAGIANLLYVVSDPGVAAESDDLNADFVAYFKALRLKAINASDFSPTPSDLSASRPSNIQAADWPPYYYGGFANTHNAFYEHFQEWFPGRKLPPGTIMPSNVVRRFYVPVARSSGFSNERGEKVTTASIGAVPVVLAATGVVAGAYFSRSGSMTRTFGSLGG